jgi:hypothetical protein
MLETAGGEGPGICETLDEGRNVCGLNGVSPCPRWGIAGSQSDAGLAQSFDVGSAS